MKIITPVGAVVLILGVAACDQQPNSQSGQSGAEGAQTAIGAPYSATGEVTAISGGNVTIAHGPVPDLQWPAMTMTFEAGSREMLSGVAAGDRVSFSFREADGGYVVTSLTKD